MKYRKKTKKETKGLFRRFFEFMSASALTLMLASPLGSRIDSRPLKDSSLNEKYRYEDITTDYLSMYTPKTRVFNKYLKLLGAEKNQISFEPSSELEFIVSNRVSQILKEDKFGNPTSDKLVFSEKMGNFSRFRDYIQMSGVDTSLAYALGIYESGGDPRAKSPTGPKGLFQFNKETALRNGAKINKYTDERLSPEATTTKLLISHLREIKDMYASYGIINPTLEQVLVSYHDGKFTNKTGKSLYESFPHLKGYIKDIIALRELIQTNLLRYVPQPLFSEVVGRAIQHRVKAGDTIHQVSRIYGVSPNSIKEANPEIVNYNKLPPNHNLRIPNGRIQ